MEMEMLFGNGVTSLSNTESVEEELKGKPLCSTTNNSNTTVSLLPHLAPPPPTHPPTHPGCMELLKEVHQKGRVLYRLNLEKRNQLHNVSRVKYRVAGMRLGLGVRDRVNHTNNLNHLLPTGFLFLCGPHYASWALWLTT